MAFATHADLATRLGLTLTATEQTRATALIADAQAVIQDETGQTIERVADDEVTLAGSYAGRVRLPQRPVVSVASVVLDGVTLTVGDEWYLDRDQIVRAGLWPSSANRFGIGGGWGDPSQTLVVTYTHGWDPVPGTVKAVCLEMVVRVWVNPGAARQEGVGPEQTTYEEPIGLMMTETEKRAVRDAVRRTTGSVTLL